MKFYKEADGDWIINGEIIPAGTCRQKTESATGRITIKLIGAPLLESTLALKMLPTQFQDVNGNYYADLAAYEAATSGFFVDAALAAAEQLEVDLGAEVQNRTSEDVNLQNQINTVASGYLGSIAYNAAAPTPAKNGWYDFSTGGVVSWLTGTPTVKIGDRVSVIYTAPSTYVYTYQNINLSGVLDQNTVRLTTVENNLKIVTTLSKVSQSPNFLNKVTGLQTGAGGGVYGTNVYNILGLRGTLAAHTKWISNQGVSICCSLLKNGVIVYKTASTIDITPTDTVELTDALDADTLYISIQLDQESSVTAISTINRLDKDNRNIAATNVKIKKPTSILWKQDLSKDITDIVGNFTQNANGITINNVGEFISLNRFYSIDRRLFRCIFTAQSGVISFGKQELVGGLTSAFFVTLNIPSGTITLGSTTINYTFVVGRKYILDIKLQYQTSTVYIQDYLNVAKASLTDLALTNMNDKYTIKLVSGSSQILNMIGVFATTEPPFLLVYGDSITFGAGVNDWFIHRYGTLIGDKTGKPYIVSGRSSGGISDIVGNDGATWKGKLLTEIQFLRPKYVMITIGTNGGNTVENLSRMVETIQSYGCIVILNNVPCRATGTIASHINEDISIKNNIIKTVRDKYKLNGCLFDLATSTNNDGITTDLSLFNQEAYTPDYIWIHPNVAGHQKMYERSLLDVSELYIDAGVSID